MSCIVIAFSKMENALKIKRILSQCGYSGAAVCTTGAQALEHLADLDGGILVCGSRFVDMMYTELFEYLPPGVRMLLLASPAVISEHKEENVICLEMPIRAQELSDALHMLENELEAQRKRARGRPKARSGEERELIAQAKLVLMERNGFSEEEAHRYLQKRSMENGTGLTETAQMILRLLDGK